MTYRVNVHKHAVKFLNTQGIETKNRLVEGLRKLVDDPFHSDVKKLKGTKGRQDLYRLRIGDYRVIFAVEEDVVYILDIFNREKGYKWL